MLPERLLNSTLTQQRKVGRLRFVGDKTTTVLSRPLAREAAALGYRWHIAAEAAAVVRCAAECHGQVRSDHTADIADGKNR